VISVGSRVKQEGFVKTTKYHVREGSRQDLVDGLSRKLLSGHLREGFDLLVPMLLSLLTIRGSGQAIAELGGGYGY